MKIFIFLFLVYLVDISVSIEWVQKKRALMYSFEKNGTILIDDGDSNVLVREQQTVNDQVKFKSIVKNFIDHEKVIFRVCSAVKCFDINEPLPTGEIKKNHASIGNLWVSKPKFVVSSDKKNITYEFNLLIVDNMKDITSEVWCDVKDSMTGEKIKTNSLDIRDYWFWKTNYVNERQEKIVDRKKIVSNQEMHVFKCHASYNPNAPKWVKYMVQPFIWSYCVTKGSSPADCKQNRKPINSLKSSLESRIIKDSLVIYNIKENLNLEIIIFCYDIAEKSYTYYGSSQSKNSIIPMWIVIPNKPPIFKIFYPKQVKTIIEKLPSVNNRRFVQFEPVVQGNMVSINYYFKGSSLQRRSHKSEDKSLKIYSPINSTNAGLYTAIVTSKMGDKFNALLELIVKTPPKLTSKVPQRIIYIPETNYLNISCSFDPDTIKTIITEANSKPITRSLELLKELDNMEVLYKANFSSGVISYQVRNITSKQDHVMTMLIRNDFGRMLIQSNVIVIPKFKFNGKSLKHYNCTLSCKSTQLQKFKCNIDLAPFVKREMNPEINWFYKVNSAYIKLENSSAANVSADGKVIAILPENDDKLKEHLKNNILICALNLTRPGWKYLDRENCKKRPDTCARITLDYAEIGNAMVYWIIVAILCFVVLLILIIVLIKYLKSNKGETYELDKLERQHGYDPEKEVREEAFKPYERGDNDPEQDNMINHSGRLSLNDASIGSGDDGELEIYDIDESQFNENGSITGQYGANPRSRTEV